jgi:spermidine dehydrogenase
MGFFSRVKLDYPVSLGEHRFAATPDDPVVLHLVHVPAGTAEVEAEAHVRARLDREALYARPLDEFEAHVRDELTRMLGPGGFDADADIAAITVNRWGHGYSYEGEPFAPEPADRPMPFAIARARAGNVAIANADAAWSSYAHVAIEQAYRAVVELSKDG